VIIEIYIDIILDVALTSSTDRLETSGPLFYYSLRLGTVILHFRSAHDWQFRTKAGVWPLDNVVNSVCVFKGCFTIVALGFSSIISHSLTL